MKLWKKLIVAVETLEAALPNALITATQKNAATISTMPNNSCRVILRASTLSCSMRFQPAKYGSAIPHTPGAAANTLPDKGYFAICSGVSVSRAVVM